MAFYIDLFSPATYHAFSESGRDLSGFRESQGRAVERVKPGDMLICYATKISRWVGLLQVEDGPFIDRTPRFRKEADPFVVRFHVRPVVWLPLDKAIPIREPRLWSSLSFTKQHSPRSTGWTGKLRQSLTRLDDEDGQLLAEWIQGQVSGGTIYQLTEDDRRKLSPLRIPDDDAGNGDEAGPSKRESIQIQALLAQIGTHMKMQIWIPRADRGRVLEECGGNPPKLLDLLPLNYDEATLKTVEQIDVIWLTGHAIQRAFEVEHTTAVYSGLLRMADLLALQPNMDIRLHIVTPGTRRSKVFHELRRPVFALLKGIPLADRCTYLSYDRVRELARQPLLAHLQESVIDEYAENAEESEE